MFLSWAIDRNRIKHDLLLSLSNFAVNCFRFQIPFRFWFQLEFDCHQIVSNSVSFSIPIGVWLSPDRIQIPFRFRFRLEFDCHQIVSNSIPFSIGVWFSPDRIRFRSFLDSDWNLVFTRSYPIPFLFRFWLEFSFHQIVSDSDWSFFAKSTF